MSGATGSLEGWFGEPEEAEKEEATAVLGALAGGPCRDCRLGLEIPDNPGFLWSGSLEAHVVVVGDMPSAGDLSVRRAFADEAGNELREWLRLAGVSEKDVLATSLVQCPTPATGRLVTVKAAWKGDEDRSYRSQRAPQEGELARCFEPRCLRLIRSLPQAEVVWLLGLLTMGAFLGGEPKVKAYQGRWFGSDLLPGKALFCLPHPRDFNSTTSSSKRGRLRQHLTYFRNEYYGKTTPAGAVLCPPRHALGILGYRERERREKLKAARLW